MRDLMTRSSEPTTTASQPLVTAPLLGGSPLIRGENVRSYDELLERICATLQPRDSLEEIWIHDIVDLVWETFRLRRAKASLMTDAARRELERQLDTIHPGAHQITIEWAAGGADAAVEVERLLASAGLSMDRIVAHAMSNALHNMERLDRMLVSVEGRRGAALRELDRHRAPLAQKLRCAIAQAEDTELQKRPPRPGPEDSGGQGALIAQRRPARVEPAGRPRSCICGPDCRLGPCHGGAGGRQGAVRDGLPHRLCANGCGAGAPHARRSPFRAAIEWGNACSRRGARPLRSPCPLAAQTRHLGI
jgi:hypothetical protein